MRKSIITTIGLSVMFLGTIAQTAVAAEVKPTMNQPDNGFYEGPNPEWAVLHATNMNGTEAHRQYHRDAVKALFLWIEQHRSERNTVAYDIEYRAFLETRNLDHRHFHTASPASASGLPYENPSSDDMTNSISGASRIFLSASRTSLNIENTTRRSIVAAAEALDRARVLAKTQ